MLLIQILYLMLLITYTNYHMMLWYNEIDNHYIFHIQHMYFATLMYYDLDWNTLNKLQFVLGIATVTTNSFTS